MKTVKQTGLAVLLGVLLMGGIANAQNKKDKKATSQDKAQAATTPTTAPADKQYFVTVTTLHLNRDKDFDMDKWKAAEKDYFDKITKNNPLILGQEVLTHYFTADNTEVLLVTMYNSWDDIEKAGDKDDELVKKAWPDETARNTYFQKRQSYYAHNHSDEIYNTFWGEKVSKTPFTKPMVYYVRKTHWAYPQDGSNKEFKDLRTQYLNAIVNQNDYIKAYYPNVHAWGANNTEFTEVFVLESLSDLEKSLARNEELSKTAWADDAKLKDFDSKYGKYFTGVHGDYIYRSVPELSK